MYSSGTHFQLSANPIWLEVCESPTLDLKLELLA